MNKKIFLFGVALLVAGQFVAAQSLQMITLSADGVETSYALENVQKIVIENNTMTVNMKTGNDATEITRIRFDEASIGFKNATGTSSVFVFPNPVKEMLTVNGVQENATINLYDLNGVLLQSVSAQENATNIYVSALQQGMYFLQIGEQVVKFIKQ